MPHRFYFTNLLSTGVVAQNPRSGNANISQQEVALSPFIADKPSAFLDAAKTHPSSQKFLLPYQTAIKCVSIHLHFSAY
ncbi:MAG: hypothetical protein ABIO05_05400 [Ferruginibacter sp.]